MTSNNILRAISEFHIYTEVACKDERRQDGP